MSTQLIEARRPAAAVATRPVTRLTDGGARLLAVTLSAVAESSRVEQTFVTDWPMLTGLAGCRSARHSSRRSALRGACQVSRRQTTSATSQASRSWPPGCF